jgi:trehalose-6-phosphate synthase
MNIISYRGPGMAGGVSTALARLMEDRDIGWLHLKDNCVQMAFGVDRQPIILGNLTAELIDGHYRFCNEFLWPVLHDLPQYSSYHEEQFGMYKKFNQILSRLIAHSDLSEPGSEFFVQDYQLALMPQILRRFGAGKTMIFWHVPWPQFVPDAHAKILAPLVKAMLSADLIGFHTSQYCRNFLGFVARHLPEFLCDQKHFRISRGQMHVTGFIPSYSYGIPHDHREIQLVTAPLGLDFDYWSALPNTGKMRIWHPSLDKRRYILSVDRADYTKGVTNRMLAIDTFFEKYPQWRGEIVFAQICNRTRPGLASFDYYWNKCRMLGGALQEKWSMGTWQPLHWFEKPFSAPQLSLLYQNAAVMLVNPVRDGLNLTAKEFTACQGINPGVLALSRGAGAWCELGDASLELNPEDPVQMADAVHQALAMPAQEKVERMQALSQKVKSNTLESWWATFSPAFVASPTATRKTS